MEAKNLTAPTYLLLNRTVVGDNSQHKIHQRQDREPITAPRVPQMPESREFPLSASQWRVWLAEQTEPGTSAHLVGRALTLKGQLDHSALERALGEIVRRHEVLRTIYRSKEPPAQEILPPAPLPLPRHDLTHLVPSERRRIASNLMMMDIARPFDLTTGPLLRAKLIRLENEEHVLVLVSHQIAMDTASLGIFFGELAELYSAFCAGQPGPLAPLPVQYADLALRQQKRSAGRSPARARAPKSSPSAVQSFKAEHPLLEKIRTFSAANEATVDLTLLAAFTILAHHWTGETEVLVSSPEAGRQSGETRQLVGCFADALTLRTRVSTEENFRKILGHVRQTALDTAAVANDYSAKPPADGPDRNLCFDVRFERIDSVQPFRLGEVLATPKTIFPPVTRFDLSLLIAELPDELTCFLEYKTGVLTTLQAAQMLEQYDRLLDQVLASPDVPVRQFLLEMDATPVA